MNYSQSRALIDKLHDVDREIHTAGVSMFTTAQQYGFIMDHPLTPAANDVLRRLDEASKSLVAMMHTLYADNVP